LKKTLITALTAVALTIPTADVLATTYTVKAGDTLSEIAQEFNTNLEALKFENEIKDANLIFAGDTLEITDATESHSDPVAEVYTSDEQIGNPTPKTPETGYYVTNNGYAATTAKEAIALAESGGSYTAQNGRYYGRYQLYSSYLAGDYSAANQERVAEAYVTSRYGSWEAAWAFWQANGWY